MRSSTAVKERAVTKEEVPQKTSTSTLKAALEEVKFYESTQMRQNGPQHVIGRAGFAFGSL